MTCAGSRKGKASSGARERRLLARLAPSPRKAALLAMVGVEQGAPVQAALSPVLETLGSDGGARRQATDLVYTHLRMERRSRFVLATLLPRPEKLPPLFRLQLSLAVTSILFQEHAPAHAVVDGTVREVRTLFGRGLDRVANAVLRHVQRLGTAPLEPDFYRARGDADELASLSRYWSLPEEVGRLWVAEYGMEAAQALMARSLDRPSPCLRVNRQKAGAQDLVAYLKEHGGHALPFCREGGFGVAFAEGGLKALGHEWLAARQQDGLLSYQSAGSQCVLEHLGIAPDGGPVWDACAGFGGKTTALLEAGVDVALASDLSWQRLSALPKECGRLGLSLPGLFLGDAAHPPLERFDGCILLDVPCSGLGVLARRPDIRRRPLDVAGLARIQTAILEAAAAVAAPGATVCYVTCTRSHEENGAQVRRAAQWGLALVDEWETPVGAAMEGMYAARLRK